MRQASELRISRTIVRSTMQCRGTSVGRTASAWMASNSKNSDYCSHKLLKVIRPPLALELQIRQG